MAEDLLHGGHILVVEDEPFVQGMLEDYLSRQGYSAIIVPTAEEAFAALKTGNIRLILLDKNLPDMSGVEVLSQIRFNNPSLPVIFMTGYPSERAKLMIRHLGVSAYFEKPVDLDVLGKVIADSLQDHIDITIEQGRDQAQPVQLTVVLEDGTTDAETPSPPQVLLATASEEVIANLAQAVSVDLKTVAVVKSVDTAYDYLLRNKVPVLAVDFALPSGTAPALVRWATERDNTLSVLAIMPPLSQDGPLMRLVEALNLRYWVETPIDPPDALVGKLEILVKRSSTLRVLAGERT